MKRCSAAMVSFYYFTFARYFGGFDCNAIHPSAV